MRPDLKPSFPSLEASVLRWTVDDITTSTLFQEQVGVIPMEFSSTEEYLRVYRVPLLEEIRAQLHQAMEKNLTVLNANHGITTSIRKIVRPKKTSPEEKSIRKILEFAVRSKTPVKTTDLILLCSAQPQWDARRECVVKSHADDIFLLACVVYARENSPMVSATVYVEDESPILQRLKVFSVWHVVLPGMSVTPARRIWNAISMPIGSKEVSEMSVSHSTLRIDPQVVPTGTDDSLHLPESSPERAETLQLVEDYTNSRSLNDSQRDVVKNILIALLAQNAKPHVRLVQGPPGTGKTSMLVTLISILGCLKLRTLISAPTNAAVLEVSKRLMRFFDVVDSKSNETFSSFCAGSVHGGMQRSFPITVRDVVLLGSKERMAGAVEGSMLEKVFLNNRIQRLQGALNRKTGWKGSVQYVVNFLSNAPAVYLAELDAAPPEHSNQGRRSKSKVGYNSNAEGKTKTTANAPICNASFWRFARNAMAKQRAQMQKAALVLTTELPLCHIDKPTSNAMVAASSLMANLVHLMPSEAPAEATSWFSATISDTLHEMFADLRMISSESSTGGKMKFVQAREEVLEALKASPGCALFVTAKHPKGRNPTYGMLKAECIKSATLVFSTVSGAGAPQMSTGVAFECAIIDEASQLVEAEATIITRMRGLKQVILVGDHKQLPATVISKVAEKCGYKRSLFDRLQTLQHGCRHMLNIQYRMKPAISHFPNSQFYEGKVQDGPNVMSPTYGISLHDAAAFGAYAFLDCKRGVEVLQQKSWKNPKEVETVIGLVTGLGKVCAARNIQQLSVGVISPYAMQVEALKQSLNRHVLHRALQVEALKQSLNRHVLHRALQVEVKSVDGFQGNERDVIIFSAVRSNHSKKLGFVDDCRRLNVAITRGRFCVWIVGNATTLSGGGNVWKELVADAKERKCFHALQG